MGAHTRYTVTVHSSRHAVKPPTLLSAALLRAAPHIYLHQAQRMERAGLPCTVRLPTSVSLHCAPPFTKPCASLHDMPPYTPVG